MIAAATTVASLTYIFRRNKKNLNKQKDIASNALQQHVQMIYREQNDNMYQEILKEFTSVYPDALDKLKKTYPELTDTELSVCTFPLLQNPHLSIGGNGPRHEWARSPKEHSRNG